MKFAIIGAGNMGGAIALGLLRSGACPVAELCVSRTHAGLPKALAGLGIQAFTDNRAAVAGAACVVLAVKPHLACRVLGEVAEALEPGALLLSVAANVSLGALQAALGARTDIALARAMPNTAVALGEGVTAVAAASPEVAERARAVLAPLGLCVAVDEARFGAVTALSGCGIAHALRFLRAAQEAGVEMGLGAAQAGEIFAQTMRGAAALVLAGGHAEAEVDRVCTPGGLTIRGLNALERAGFTGAVVQGLLASQPEA